MSHSAQLNDLMNDLFCQADQNPSNGSSLPPGARPALDSAFTRMLVNPERLNEHIRYLQKEQGTPFPHQEPLDEATIEAVVRDGLTVLDDAALARLVLNPVALAALADEIEERQPTGWAEALRDDGLELLRAQGRTVPPLEKVLKPPAAVPASPLSRDEPDTDHRPS
jgi:hypothetical protein